MLKKFSLWTVTLLLSTFSFTVFAQEVKKINFNFNEVTMSEVAAAGIPQISASQYKLYKLNVPAITPQLIGIDHTDIIRNGFEAKVAFPHPDGTIHSYLAKENSTMDSVLAAMFPEIKSYDAYGEGDVTVKWDITPHGFHAMIMVPGQSSIFIDPVIKGNTQYYIVYHAKNIITSKTMQCDVQGTYDFLKKNGPSVKSYGSCEKRTYRLALAATGEYTAFHGGTVALAQAAQVTTMNRINGVYMREMAIQMNIIANNNLIIYTNSATDPYTNNNGSTMLNENQTNLTNVIGGANYDIGHVFSTGGGGIAQLQSVCNSTGKARGVTGSGAPIGDAFDIDYVAHEIGHQFGCNHTFNNSNNGSCNGNASAANSFEPGSGSTIMAYAGICSPTNVQSNSDDYFHANSLREMGAFITSAGHTCPVKTALTNAAPTVTPFTAISIPQGTPFFLTATATDPNPTDVLTYCWEQMDAGTATAAPTATQTARANFRSFDPTTSPTRYFPSLTALAANGPFTWEVLPTVARTMNFRVVARDNAAGGGCNDEENIAVSVISTAGPFVVTYPSATGITWAGASTQTVTWNVASTNLAPINCSNVDILLSIDGGATYPTVLATAVANDGSQVISVPNTPSTTCRIMVRASGGNFFDISDNNFTITASTFDYTMTTTPASISICQGGTAAYSISIGSIGGYNSPVTLSVTGVPAGATSSFTTSPVTPVGTSTLNITNTGTVAPGSYTLTITGTSAAGTKVNTVTLIVSSGSPSAVTQLTPANAATGINVPTTFTWTTAPEIGVTYSIQIATDAAFASIVDQATGLTSATFTSSILAQTTTYYWRVRSVTGCGTSAWSSSRTFTTSSCVTIAATTVPVAISGTGTPTITSTITVATGGTISDVNILNLTGTHSYISDLTVRITSPAGTVVTLFAGICTNNANFNLNFDDAAASATIPCPPTTGGTFQPNQVLSAFNGQNAAGVWTLTIVDGFDVDGGSLNSWSLNLCVNPCTVPTAPGTITGSTTPCSSSTGNTYSIAAVAGATSYTWTVPAGATVTAGQGTTSATVTFGSTSGNVSVTATNACGTSTASNLAVTLGTAPATPGTITGSASLCANSTANTYSIAAVSGATSYTWTVPAGATITSGQGTTAIVVNMGSTSGNVTVTATNTCGTSTAATLAVTINTAPSTPGTISGTGTICSGSTGNVYSIAAVAGATSYVWTVPAGSSITAGQGTTSITVTGGSTSGTIAVVATNSCGSSTASSLVLTINAAPSAPVVSVTNNCGNSVLTATGTNWLWSTGATTSSITVTTAGTYTVTQTVAGCTSPAGSGIAAPLAIPSAPAVTVTNNCGNSVLTATGSNLLWSTGATTASITVTTTGTYTVTQTVGGCTSAAGSGIAAPQPITPTQVTLTSPANSAVNVAIPVSFSWSAAPEAGVTYSIQVATDAAFTNIVAQSTGLATNSYSSSALTAGTTYYWHVQTVSPCGSSAYSTTFSFTTSSCTTYASTVVPVVISATGTPTVTSTITIPTGGTINDVNVIDLNGTHTRVRNLTFTLTSPAGTVVNLMSQPCTNAAANFNIDFDDAAASAVYPCPPTDGLAYQPLSVLSAFNGQNAAGVWTLTISDNATNNGGQLNGWSLQVCTTPLVPCTNPDVAVNSGNTTICSGNTTALSVVSGNLNNATNWNWYSGSCGGTLVGTGTSISVSPTSTTTYFVRGEGGCVVAGTCSQLTVTVNPTPAAPVVSGVDGCGSSVLTATGTNLLWSTGATTSSITVTTAGAYTVTQTVGGCTSAPSTQVANPNTTPTAPIVTVTNNCGNSVLTATGSNLLWSTGATTASITVTTGGTYTVTQTVSGCTSAAGSGVAAPLAVPSITLGTTTNPTTCATATGSIVINGSGTGTVSWTGTATGSATGVTLPYTIAGLTAGTYSITFNNGCVSNTLSGSLADPSAPSAPVTTVLNNCGNSVLTASGSNLVWSTGATTSSITVTTAGTYTVTQMVGGCTSAPASITAAPNAIPSAPSVSGVDGCGSSVLTATGTNLLWSTGATTASITVTTAGAYTVTQTVGGCTSAPATVAANPIAAPSAPVTTVLNNCGNSILTASGSNLVWSTGATTSSITVTTPGVYTVTQTIAGCTSAPASVTAAPNAIPSAPSVSGVDGCGSSVLTATGTNLLWSTGATTASITVTTAGAYTVTQTVGGCTSAPSTVAANPIAAPSAPVTTVLNNCGNSVLTASGSNLVWSTGATTSSITVTTAGVYTVTQTISGCTSAPASITAAPNAIPSAPSVSGVDGCGSSVLTATGTNLLWSTGATTASITVTAAGAYTVTQTVGGCTSAPATVAANPLAAPSAPIATVVDGCGSSVLTATGSNLLWSTGATTSSITVTNAGAYTVTQTVGGCTSAPATVAANPTSGGAAPTTTVTNNCGNSVLTVSGTGSILWSTGETTSTINVSSAGTYTVTLTNGSCTSTPATVVAAPVAIPSTPIITVNDKCGTSDLMTSATGSLMWSTSETTSMITVTTPGTYYVSQTVNGCTSPVGTAVANPFTVPSVIFPPLADVCINTPVFTLTGATPAGGVYTGTGVTANQFDPSVAGYGVFTILYTYTDANGCSNSNQQPITVGCAGIDDVENVSLAIYPNPSNGIFTITTTGQVVEKVNIFDAAGRLVQIIENSSKLVEIPVNLSTYAEGVYTLEIKTNNSTSRERLVLAK
jgi:subtilisin-like proprotein convertase family protein